MNPLASKFALALVSATCLIDTVHAQEDMKLPATAEDKEAFYADILERRVQDILTAVPLNDAAKKARVRDALILHYRSLRLRDEVIRVKLAEQDKAGGGTLTREELFRSLSRPLHDWFVGVLALELAPEQVEAIKDKMTYNKVAFTYNAYCEIVPRLAEAEKARILELLKAARDEAMDGGSAGEKSAIFQKYKDQINAYLDGNGHNVAQAIKDWEAKHPTKQTAAATPGGSPSSN